MYSRRPALAASLGAATLLLCATAQAAPDWVAPVAVRPGVDAAQVSLGVAGDGGVTYGALQATSIAPLVTRIGLGSALAGDPFAQERALVSNGAEAPLDTVVASLPAAPPSPA